MLGGCGRPLIMPVFESRDRDPQSELAIHICNTGELWVHLRDPASVNKAERDGGRLSVSALGLHMLEKTCTNMDTYEEKKG